MKKTCAQHLFSAYLGNPNTVKEMQGSSDTFGQKLRKIWLMKVCAMRKCWKARILGTRRFSAETDFIVDSKSRCRKAKGLLLGPGIKK